MKKDVSKFCRLCHVCQMVRKPNQKIPRAPLQPIPAFEEPLSRVLIDCVGPLPKSKSGNEYFLTIMCTLTRFPEVIPLRNIKAKTIVQTLIKFLAPLAVGQRAYVTVRCRRASVRPCVNFFLNIFFSETTYRILIKFHRNVLAIILFKIF